MALYEIVLRFPDRDEIRITDRNGYHDGQEVVIEGRRFLVTGSEQPQAASAAGRFVLELHGWPQGVARPPASLQGGQGTGAGALTDGLRAEI